MIEVTTEPTRFGVVLRVHLNAVEQAVVGADARAVVEWAATVLHAVTLLRVAPGEEVRPAMVAQALPDVQVMASASAGVIAALVRAHARLGGPDTALAMALGVDEAAAAEVREATVSAPVSAWESWALGGERP